MYEVLHKRREPLTQEEMEIVQNKRPLSTEAAQAYLNQLDSLSKNIQDMFIQQAAAQQVP
jgi:hypothetical protein